MDQSPRSLFVKSRLVDCIDEAAGDDVQDLVEKPSTLLGLAFLKYEGSGHQWNHRQAEERGFS